MFRQLYNSICFVICVCALVILAGYRYLNDIGYPSLETFNLLQPNSTHPKTEPLSYADTILDMTRTMIKIETWNYNFTHSDVGRLEDLVMETGGTPVRNIIVSTWRSGSSFLGDLINSVPGSFYSYEPLMMFGAYKQIKGPPHAASATNVLQNILKCDYKNKTDFVKYFTFARDNLKHNKRFWNKCSHKRELCFDGDFISKFCQLCPFHVVKLDRFRMPLVKNILDDKELNVKIILLVRDPRGVMHSRRQIKNFCSARKVPDCSEPRLVCSDMVSDYKTAANFLHNYSDRLMVLRYEDLAFNLRLTTLQLLKFLKIEHNSFVHEFLKTHSTVSNSEHYSTVRITKNVPFKWRKTMKFKAVKEIQEKCKEAMTLWGYALAHNVSQLASKKFNPLLPYSVNKTNLISKNKKKTKKNKKNY